MNFAYFVLRAVDCYFSIRTIIGEDNDKRQLLRRNSSTRVMLNSTYVEELLISLGFTVVEPKNTFSEQVNVFHKASIIVAQAGAALGNMLFAPRGCKVVILAALSPHNNYYYFSNMAEILNQKVTYVFSHPALQKGEHPAHAGFNADIDGIKEALGE